MNVPGNSGGVTVAGFLQGAQSPHGTDQVDHFTGFGYKGTPFSAPDVEQLAELTLEFEVVRDQAIRTACRARRATPSPRRGRRAWAWAGSWGREAMRRATGRTPKAALLAVPLALPPSPAASRPPPRWPAPEAALPSSFDGEPGRAP